MHFTNTFQQHRVTRSGKTNWLLLYLCASVFIFVPNVRGDAPAVSYAQVHEVFKQHCLGCHDQKEAEGGLVMETFDLLMKGGDSGKPIVAGKADESLLVQLIEHTKKPYMPPPKKAKAVPADQIAVIKAWINAGAKPPAAGEPATRPSKPAPVIQPRVAPRKSIQSIAYSPNAKLLALARLDVVELLNSANQQVVRTLTGHTGHVNDIAFSPDGSLLAAACGATGQRGEVRLWHVAEGKLVRTISGHKDAIYAVAFSPDGKLLATGSYDQNVMLWSVSDGQPQRTLSGHNGAIFSVAFRPDGKVIASASADRTVKLWSVATGERLDTRDQGTKEQQAVAWSPDGKFLVAAGVDNRIRLYSVSDSAAEGSNPLLVTRFAHEGSILRLAYSPDGKSLLSTADNRTVKVWDTARELTQRLALADQPDWPTGAAFIDNTHIAIGRLDGSLTQYDLATGSKKPVAAMPKKKAMQSAEATITPHSVQRGSTIKLTVAGPRSAEVTKATLLGPPELKLNVTSTSAGAVTLEAAIPADYPPGIYEISTDALNRMKLAVDDLPQVERGDKPVTLPVSVNGVFKQRGDVEQIIFDAAAGQTLVIDVTAKRLGSKADVVLSLLGPAGEVVATNANFDGEPDPLLAYTVKHSGRYTVKLTELMAAGSADHFYRVSIGHFAMVTGVYPLAISANQSAAVTLLGFNLPNAATVKVPASPVGEVSVPIDASKFRVRRQPKLLVSDLATVLEQEPNDKPAQAVRMSAPGAADGRINAPGDVDLYRFTAKAGQQWIIETLAAQRSSPTDTKIEVLDAAGKPVPRLKLMAVRDAAITFRPVTADNPGARFEHWEEMDLRQYVYMNGEVVRLFLAPRGPDSEWKFYEGPATGSGKRRNYFDTSPSTHPIDEAVYVVEPKPLNATLPLTGLPVFTVNFANDDDELRQIGSDSRLHFTAPADGDYLVRVTDTRGFGGERYAYRLVIRPAKPDFGVTIPGTVTVGPGGGASFDVRINRMDGFDDPVRIDITGAPKGVTVSSPLIVEAGHTEASGVVYVDPSVKADDLKTMPQLKVTATAMIGGQKVEHTVANPPRITVIGKPKVTVRMTDAKGLPEITVVPGQLVPAKLAITRDGFDGRVSFELENAPHGVIIADIGLSGVLVREKELDCQIFLQCAPWVEEQDRLVFVKSRERELDNVTTRPVMMHVRRSSAAAK
jgi:WD40 repeat protein